LPAWLRSTAEGVTLDLAIQPRASRSRIVGEHGDRLKVQIAAPPVDGEANTALVELLADVLGIPRRHIEIAAGATGKRKTVRIAGVDAGTIERALASKGP